MPTVLAQIASDLSEQSSKATCLNRLRTPMLIGRQCHNRDRLLLISQIRFDGKNSCYRASGLWIIQFFGHLSLAQSGWRPAAEPPTNGPDIVNQLRPAITQTTVLAEQDEHCVNQKHRFGPLLTKCSAASILPEVITLCLGLSRWASEPFAQKLGVQKNST